MARADGDDISPKLEREGLQELFSGIRNIDSPKDVSGLLDSFFTNKEKRLIFRRIAILNLLKNKKTYSNIKELLKVSKNTISKVRDITEERGYGRNPNRKRVYGSSYSILKTKHKEKKLFRRYKGAESII